MERLSISRHYLKPIVVGLLLCGFSGFALGQALSHWSAPTPAYVTISHATGALGTVTPTTAAHSSIKRTTTPTETTATPPSVTYVPAAYHPAVSPSPHSHPHHKAKHNHKHDGDAHHGGQDEGHVGHGGHGDKGGHGGHHSNGGGQGSED